MLELTGRGDGQLRDPKRNLAVRPDDPYVPAEVVRKYGLRGGEHLEGAIEPAQGGANGTHLKLTSVNNIEIANWEPPPVLEDTTAIDPDRQLRFSTPGGPHGMWIIDILTPIGFGQRGLLVAAPRTGKTVLLQQIAHGVATNYPEVYMIVLLVDERPEEVTEMRRNV
ncbi:MAG: transcription termination factor Rho, partial [Phycisphaerae bacterium]|nr:transcription termination factor Rho [Phycisphaerae bacterium]